MVSHAKRIKHAWQREIQLAGHAAKCRKWFKME